MFNINEYRVYFNHSPEESGGIIIKYEDGRTVETRYVGRTTCFITKNDETIHQGSSFCSLSDVFDKAKGRRVSLARALEGADKEFRTLIWTEYLKHTKR